MISPQCVVCSRPVADQAYACGPCGARLDAALAEAAALAPELAVTVARLGATGGHGGGRSTEVPLPYDPAASSAAWMLGNTVTSWARHVADERGQTLPQSTTPGDPVTSATVAAGWLRGHVEWLRHRPEAGEAVDEIAYAVAEARHRVDHHRPDRWYAGPCDCGRDLYAHPGAATVTCPDCDLTWPVDARREWMLATVADTVATAAEASRALTALGRQVTASMVYNYAARGRIVAVDQDRQGRPLYRIGAVLEAFEQRRKRGWCGAA